MVVPGYNHKTSRLHPLFIHLFPFNLSLLLLIRSNPYTLIQEQFCDSNSILFYFLFIHYFRNEYAGKRRFHPCKKVYCTSCGTSGKACDASAASAGFCCCFCAPIGPNNCSGPSTESRALAYPNSQAHKPRQTPAEQCSTTFPVSD